MSKKSFKLKFVNNLYNLLSFSSILLIFLSNFFTTQTLFFIGIGFFVVYFLLSIIKIIDKFLSNGATLVEKFLFLNRFLPIKQINDFLVNLLPFFFCFSILEKNILLCNTMFFYFGITLCAVSVFSFFFSLRKIKGNLDCKLKNLSESINEFAAILKFFLFIFLLYFKVFQKKVNVVAAIFLLSLSFVYHFLKIIKDVVRRKSKLGENAYGKITKNHAFKFFAKEVLFNISLFATKLTFLGIILGENLHKNVLKYLTPSLYGLWIVASVFLVARLIQIVCKNELKKIRFEKEKIDEIKKSIKRNTEKL